MQCPECEYDIDEVNESISVCPRCGADPNDPDSWPDPSDDPMVVDALADLADFKREDEEERKLQEEPASKLIN
jgi:hypothetical protein